MRKEEKLQLIQGLTQKLNETPNIYLTDIEAMDSVATSDLRRLCFKREIKLEVVKNSLLQKAMEASDKDFNELYEALKGSTSVMYTETGNAPAKLIKEFRKTNNSEKPLLKGAFVEETCYVGEEMLETLVNIKSKNELIADVVALLQSPAKNVISGLQSGGNVLTGVLKTLSERGE